VGQFVHQPVVDGEFEEEAGVEVQAPAGSSVATDLALVVHSRCHRTCWVMTALVAPLGKPVAAGIACAGQTDDIAVARNIVVAVVAGDVAAVAAVDVAVVAEMVVGVQVFGGDSSSARGRPECHNRRTRSRCLQGLQNEGRSNS
jgi:hypothetical protein